MYILDTSIFVESARRYYAFDLVPGFWNALLDRAEQKEIGSIDRVLQELQRGKENDAVRLWAEKQRADAKFEFASTKTEPVLAAYGKIIRWANENPQYKLNAKNEFAKDDIADAWLVAYVKACDGTVVTNEKDEPNAKRRILIPNVCEEFGVSYMDQFEMMRKLGMQLG